MGGILSRCVQLPVRFLYIKNGPFFLLIPWYFPLWALIRHSYRGPLFSDFFAELLGETFFLITAVIIISGRLQCRQRRSVVSPGGCCRNNNTGSALIQDVSRIDFYPKRKTWNLADSPSTKSKMRARLIDFDISVRIQPNILIQHNRIKIIIITLAIYTFPFIF